MMLGLGGAASSLISRLLLYLSSLCSNKGHQVTKATPKPLNLSPPHPQPPTHDELYQ